MEQRTVNCVINARGLLVRGALGYLHPFTARLVRTRASSELIKKFKEERKNEIEYGTKR